MQRVLLGRRCCSCGPSFLEAIATAVALGAVDFEEFLDEPRRFHPVERLDALAETFHGEQFDVPLFKAVFVDDLQNEAPLLVGTGPCFALPVAAAVAGSAVGGRVAGLITVARRTVAAGLRTVGVPIAIGRGPVGMPVAGQETGLLDILVHTPLQQGVQAGGFGFDHLCVGEFGADGDAVLMGGIPGEPEFLGVIRFEGDGH